MMQITFAGKIWDAHKTSLNQEDKIKVAERFKSIGHTSTANSSASQVEELIDLIKQHFPDHCKSIR